MISIIIPTYNEEKNIARTIASIGDSATHEVIVVDGGSLDQTVNIARSMGVKTVSSKPGRAIQMNSGARLSSGDIFLFLHGDSSLPADFSKTVCDTLSQPNIVAGAFRLAIDHPGIAARVVEKMVAWRSRFFQSPYGDQAIFLRKKTFEEVGGYGDVVFLEDYLLIRRLRKIGKIRLADSKVLTSGRRWRQMGVCKTTIINQAIILGFLLGFRLLTLKKLYRVAKKG